MYLYRAGQPNEDLFTLLGENVRKAEEVLGDVHSFVAANQLGADRLLAFMDDYGMHDLRALAAVVQNRSEAAVREAIGKLPDGEYTSEIWNNPLGTKLRYPLTLTLTVQGEAIELDFTGAPPQQPQGGLNCGSAGVWRAGIGGLIWSMCICPMRYTHWIDDADEYRYRRRPPRRSDGSNWLGHKEVCR